MVLQFPATGKLICNQCVLDINSDLAGDADDTIRCFTCDNITKFVVEYSGGTEVTYEAGPTDENGRQVYKVLSVEGSFSKLSKFKCVRCVKCESRIPQWVVLNHRYLRVSHQPKPK